MYHKLTGRNKKGFTLLELLIVIAIIAILSVILILVLDPAETLKKSRDSQRIADLNTLKTALGIYTTTATSSFLGGAGSNLNCKTGAVAGASVYPTQTATVRSVWYSSPTSTYAIQGTVDGTASTTAATAGSSTLTDGTGWVPVNLDGLTSGSPISNEPLDPTNSIAAPSTGPTSADLVYRYTCNASTTKWEADAVLESNAFTVTDDKRAKDGGNNPSYYEIGTDLKLLGSGTNF